MNNWDDLLYFHILVSQQTLTAAAETLGVQHSTVSRRIARLEATLGLRLFDRMGRRYLLTADGARIHEQTQDIAIRMNTLMRTAREQREAAIPISVWCCKATPKSATCTTAKPILRCAPCAPRKTT